MWNKNNFLSFLINFRGMYVTDVCLMDKARVEECLYLFCTCSKTVFRPASKQVLRGTEGKVNIAAE